MPLRPSQRHTVSIEGYASTGEGIGRIEGRAVFVAGGVRGETVKVHIDKVGKSAVWAHVEGAPPPSARRAAPDCPHYGACGGCQLRHLTYEEELCAKRQRVEDALHRLGGLNLPVSIIYGAENTIRYRNKVQFPLAPPGRIGFYRPRSHRVVDIADCLLQPPVAGRLRAALLGFLESRAVPVYDESRRTGLLRHLCLRIQSDGGTLCCLVANGTALPYEDDLIARLRAAAPELTGILLNINTRDTNVVLGRDYRTLWGRDFLEERLCGLTFRVSFPAFFQVNRAQTEVLYRVASEFAALTGGETLLDLYCGVGTIGLTMAGCCRRLVGVESVPAAVENARTNAALNGIHNAEFHAADADALTATLAAAGARPDVVILDPPRKGLSPDTPGLVASLVPTRIVYVSCDPATLARDAARFTALGYRAEQAAAVDLFPRTAHIESVLLLTRK